MKKIKLFILLFLIVFLIAACKDDEEIPTLPIDTEDIPTVIPTDPSIPPTDPTMIPTVPSLTSPTDVVINGDILSWNAVTDADFYIVFIGDYQIPVTGTQLDLSEETLPVGLHSIVVIAVNEHTQSLPSQTVQYTVSVYIENVILSILTIFDPSYTQNMTRNDFQSDWEYEDYLSTVRMVNAYAEATTVVNMTDANALGLFQDFYDMTTTNMPQNIGQLMNAMEMFDTYQATPFATATILYHLVLTSMELQLENELRYEYGNPKETLDMIEALEINGAITISSLEVVISFIMDFRSLMSTQMITLLDNVLSGNSLSNTEIIIIKNELVSILYDVLPSANEFELLYTTFMYIGESISDTAMTNYIAEANFLGELTHQTITITLEFLLSINVQTLEDIMLLLSELYVYDPYFGYEYIDPEQAVLLALFALTYISEFKDDNELLFDNFEALLGSDSVEAIFTLIIDQIIIQLESDIYVDEITIVFLQTLKDEYHTINDALNVLKSIGENVIMEFIASDAGLFLDLLYIDQILDELTTEQTINYITNELLPMMINYNTAIFSELDQEGILALLNLIKIPLIVSVTANDFGMSQSLAIDLTYFDEILPDVAQIILNLITLETALLDTISTVDITAIIDNENIDDMEMASVLVLVSILDATLTSQHEMLIFDTIDIIFNSILKDSSMMELHRLTVSDIDSMAVTVFNEIDYFIEEIHDIANFDFNSLTTDEMDRITAISDLINMFIGGGSINPYPNLMPIQAGDNLYLELDYNESVQLIFEPTQSGYYTLESTSLNSGGDPFVSLLDSFGNLLVFNDDVNGYDFKLTAYFHAGQTYFFEVGVFNYTSFYVSLEEADDSGIPDSIPQIYADDIVTIDYGQYDVYFMFIPEESGYYWVYSDVQSYSPDTMITILDHNYDILHYDDDSGVNFNFFVNYYFTAYEVYYFVIAAYENDVSFNVSLVKK